MKLNVGCGTDVLPGWVNVDRHPGPGVTQADLGAQWPWKTGTVSEVLASHVLEHVEDPYHFVSEAARVLRPGGVLRLFLPYWADPVAAWGNLDHKRAIHPHAFNVFVDPGATRDANQRSLAAYSRVDWRISRREPYRGPTRWGLFGGLLARFGVAWAWRIREIEVVLTR